MDNLTQEAQPQPEATRTVLDPAECPTCVSGVDPNLGGFLFQEALRESL